MPAVQATGRRRYTADDGTEQHQCDEKSKIDAKREVHYGSRLSLVLNGFKESSDVLGTASAIDPGPTDPA